MSVHDSGYATSSLHGTGAKQMPSNPLQQPCLADTYNMDFSPIQSRFPYREPVPPSVSEVDTLAGDEMSFYQTYDATSGTDPLIDGSQTLQYTGGMVDSDVNALSQFSFGEQLQLTQNYAPLPLSPQNVQSSMFDISDDTWSEPAMKRQFAPHPDAQSHRPKKRVRSERLSSSTVQTPATSSPHDSSIGPASQVRLSQQSSSTVGYDYDKGSEYSQASTPPSRRHRTSAVAPKSVPAEVSSSPAKKEARETGKQSERSFPCPRCANNKHFKTKNDLDRHRRTLHRGLEIGEKVFLCSVPGCAAAKKLWPRFDNFKQHVIRMHGHQYEAAIDGMAHSYDPMVHGVMEETKSGKKSVPCNLTQRNDSRTGFVVDDSRSRRDANVMLSENQDFLSMNDLGHNGVLIANQQHPPWTAHSCISIGHDPPTQYHSGVSATAHSNSKPLQRVTRGARSWADPYTSTQQQRELYEQDVQFAQQQPVSASTGDLHFVGEMTDQVDPVVAPQAGRHDHRAETIVLGGAYPQTGKVQDILELIRLLPPSQQQQLRSQFPDPGRATLLSAKSLGKDEDLHTDGTRTRDKMCGVEKCTKTFSNISDLHKHERRHAKTYGCTFDNCFKRFGTKWEWKRHESTQHVQLEEWRCQFGQESGTACATHFDSKDKLVVHLIRQHGLSSPMAETRTSKYWLAKRWLGSYWCGFCKTIEESKAQYGKQMESERYDHISKHVENTKAERTKRDMDCWVELKGNGQTKGQMSDRAEKAKKTSDDDVGPEPQHSPAEQPEEQLRTVFAQDELDKFGRRPLLNVDTGTTFASSSCAMGRQSLSAPVPELVLWSAPEQQFHMGSELQQAPQHYNEQGQFDSEHLPYSHGFFSGVTCCHCRAHGHQQGATQCSTCGYDFCQDCQYS